MKIDLGQHARPDLAFRGLLVMFAEMTKHNVYQWQQAMSTAATIFTCVVAQSKDRKGFGEDLGDQIYISIEFTENACFGSPNRKTERFRFGVVVDRAHQIMDVRSDADTYDLFARLFKAAYDSVKKHGAESVTWRTKDLNWSDILGRKWKISKSEIRKIAEESLNDRKRDFFRALEEKTRELTHSYQREGFTVTGKAKDRLA